MSEDGGLSTGTPMNRDPAKQLACHQCRARKVKCDRQLPVCGACARLQFNCSFVSGEAPDTTPQPGSCEDVTKAGTKRKRIRRACVPCKAAKEKCSGSEPCERCTASGRLCRYADTGRPSGVPSPFQNAIARAPSSTSSVTGPQPPVGLTAAATNITSPDHMNSLAPRTVPSLLSGFSDKSTARKYIDVYFDKVDFSANPFLHKATLITDLYQDQLDGTLLKAICASGLHLLSPGDPIAEAWMREVQDQVVGSIGSQSLTQLQTLLLLIRYRYDRSVIGDVWMLLPTAARIAFTKRLNYEHREMDPVQQEILRRMMWSIFVLDKILSGGLDDLVVCPTERLHIRLPSSDQNFERGLPSKAPSLAGDATGDISEMDATGHMIKQYAVREHVLRYTKRMVRNGSRPTETRSELYGLDRQLQTLQDELPDVLKLNPRRLTIMAHTSDAGKYIMLHTKWYLYRSDLHSILVTGLRESVSNQVFEETPPEYAEHCQRVCLDCSISLCDLWSAYHHLDTGRPILDPAYVMTIYQCTARLDHLSHMLPESGEHSIDALRVKLTEALSMTEPLRSKYSWAQECADDIEKMLPQLGLQRSRESSSGFESALPHSKHSFIRFNMQGNRSARAPNLSPLTTPDTDAFDRAQDAPLGPTRPSLSDFGMYTPGTSTSGVAGRLTSGDEGVGLPFNTAGHDLELSWEPYHVDVDASYPEDFTSLFYIN